MFDLLDEAKIEEMKLVCLNLCNMFLFVFTESLNIVFTYGYKFSNFIFEKELLYDQAKEHGDTVKIQDISNSLFLLQKKNADRLKDLINEYNPAPFVNQWGSDPDYLNMIKNLETIEINAGKFSQSARNDIFEHRFRSKSRGKIDK
jgi:hypothetical protein